MKYAIPSAKFVDIESKTVRLTLKAAELGTVDATTITIDLDNLALDALVAGDVFIAHNVTEDTYGTPSIASGNLVLTDVAYAATDVINLVYRIK
jgi:hypothetical protein